MLSSCRSSRVRAIGCPFATRSTWVIWPWPSCCKSMDRPCQATSCSRAPSGAASSTCCRGFSGQSARAVSSTPRLTPGRPSAARPAAASTLTCFRVASRNGGLARADCCFASRHHTHISIESDIPRTLTTVLSVTKLTPASLDVALEVAVETGSILRINHLLEAG